MQTLIDEVNMSVVPAGADRNKWRDDKYTEMCAIADDERPTSFFSDASIGASLANLAILRQVHDVELLRTLTKHESAYVADKAMKVSLDKVIETMPYEKHVYEEGFMGCVMGQAVGDAVGLPVEGHDRDMCVQYVKEVVQPQLTCSYHRHGMKFGQYSDDTQLTREMYLTVLQTKGLMDPVVYALRIALLFQPGAYRVVGYGKQTARAAEAIRKGTHWTDSGCTKGQGNGGVMRSACIGALLMKKAPQVVTENAKNMSSITHASPACIDGAKAIALATKYALTTRKESFSVSHFVSYLIDKGDLSDEYKAHIRMLGNCVKTKQPWEEVAKHLVDMCVKKGERRWGNGISIGTRQTALWALYCFMTYPDSYVDCISLAIAVGGDVDTTAATVGGIIGARVGLASIPTVWQHVLQDIGEWTYKDLIDMGQKAWDLVDRDMVHQV